MKTIFSPSERPGQFHHVPQEWRLRLGFVGSRIDVMDRNQGPEATHQIGVRHPSRAPLLRQSLDCFLGIAPRDAELGVLSGR
jgi:hypothetical protein